MSKNNRFNIIPIQLEMAMQNICVAFNKRTGELIPRSGVQNMVNYAQYLELA